MAGRTGIIYQGNETNIFQSEPEFSHFIKRFKKTTNFARINNTIKPSNDIGFGKIHKFSIPVDSGDILGDVSVKIVVPKLSENNLFKTSSPFVNGYNECTEKTLDYIDNLGTCIIEYVELVIGGIIIDRQTTDTINIHDELNLSETQEINNIKLKRKQYKLNQEFYSKMPSSSFGHYSKLKTIDIADDGNVVLDDIMLDYPYDRTLNKQRGYLNKLNDCLGHSIKIGAITYENDIELLVNIPFYFLNKPELYIPIFLLKQEVEVIVKLRDIDEIFIQRNISYKQHYLDEDEVIMFNNELPNSIVSTNTLKPYIDVFSTTPTESIYSINGTLDFFQSNDLYFYPWVVYNNDYTIRSSQVETEATFKINETRYHPQVGELFDKMFSVPDFTKFELINDINIVNIELSYETYLLEQDEKNSKLNKRLDYIITQTQYKTCPISEEYGSLPNIKMNLNFKNPIREMFLLAKRDKIKQKELGRPKQYYHFPFSKFKLNRHLDNIFPTDGIDEYTQVIGFPFEPYLFLGPLPWQGSPFDFVSPIDYDNTTDREIIVMNGNLTPTILPLPGTPFNYYEGAIGARRKTYYHNIDKFSLKLNGHEIINKNVTDTEFNNFCSSGINYKKVPLTSRFKAYNFGLESYTPYSTGYINFSHFQNQVLDVDLFSSLSYYENIGFRTIPRTLYVYATSFNVLRFENGVAKLLF